MVLFALAFLVGEAGDNLEAKSIHTGFDFLEVDPDIALGEGIDTDPATSGRALWVGMVNTIRMAIAGIALATVLGILDRRRPTLPATGSSPRSPAPSSSTCGTSRCSSTSSCSSSIATVFPAFGENVDPSADVTQGPINGVLHISNKGISIPRVHIDDGFYQWLIVVLVGVAVLGWVEAERHGVQDRTGQVTYPVLSAARRRPCVRLLSAGSPPDLRLGRRRCLRSHSPMRSTEPHRRLVQLLLTDHRRRRCGVWIKRFFDAGDGTRPAWRS